MSEPVATSLNPLIVKGAQRPVEPESFSLRDVLNVAFYYRRIGLLIAGLIFLIGLVVAFLIPPSYTTRARVLALNSGVYQLAPGANGANGGPNSTVAVDVEMQILDSSELHRATVIRDLGPGASELEIDKAVEKFEDHLHLSKLETGDVIEITFRDRSPKRAAQLLRSMLQVYFEQRANVLTSGRVSYLTTQRDRVRAQLDQANAQIEAYEQQNGIADITAQISSAVTLDGVLRQREAESRGAVADDRDSVEVLEDSARNVPKEVELYTDNTEAAHTIGTMEAELFQLEAKRDDLASRYMATSPFVQQADAQIAALKKSIDEQKADATVAHRTGYNAYHDTVTDRLAQARATLAGDSGRHAVLESQLAQSSDHLKELLAISDVISKLTTQRDLISDSLKDIDTQLQQARTQQNEADTVSTTNVHVVEQPEVPFRRNNPRILFIAAGLVTALLVAAIVIIILTSVRETFLSPQEAERGLRVPVLCDLPLRDKGPINRRDFGRLIAALDSVPTSGLGKTVLLLTAQTPGKVQAVAKGLVEALEPRAPGRIVLVHMEEDAAAPVESALMAPLGKDHVMTIGMVMTRTRLINLFHEFRSAYDYVVITAPPASAWFESLELSTVADLSTLVIQADQTRKPVAQAVITQAGYIGGKISGLILTGRQFSIPSWIYRILLTPSK